MNRKVINRLFLGSTQAAVGLSLLIVIFIFGVILYNGIPAINFSFLLTKMEDFGASGGIFYQAIGSLLLVITAAAISFPIALGTAIYKSEYMKSSFHQKMCGAMIYGLNGVPSVIFGIFGFILFVNIFGMGISWFVGGVILAMMILPTIVLTAYQSIHSIPQVYRDNALAMGFSQWQLITKVIIPQSINGAITGLFIGLARAIGETAPIMFIATAFSGVEIPSSIFEPTTALPTHILALSQQATNPLALKNAWGASLVLLCLVMIFGWAALYSRKKLSLRNLR